MVLRWAIKAHIHLLSWVSFLITEIPKVTRPPDISGKIENLSGKITSETRPILRWKFVYTVFAKKVNYEFKWTFNWPI